MAFLHVLSEWLDGSGQTSITAEAGVLTVGISESLSTRAHVTRTHHVHQVTVTTLYVLQKMAYDCYLETTIDENDNYFIQLGFEEWKVEVGTAHPQFWYWNSVLELEILLNMVIKSQQSGKFAMYVKYLNEMILWFFALDHVHYVRWLPIHAKDLMSIDSQHPQIFEKFLQRHFIVLRSHNRFSRMALD